jgi:hypothetical protein
MDRKNVVYIHSGTLLRHKKEIMPFVTTWMNQGDIILSEINKPGIERQTLHDLTWMWSIKKVKLVEADSRKAVARG